MTDDDSRDAMERDVERSLKAAIPPADSALEARLVESILAEVKTAKALSAPAPAARRARVRLRVFAAAAAVLIAAFVAYRFSTGPESAAPAGEVTPLYGITRLVNGHDNRLQAVSPLMPGQTLATAWGSKAEVVLSDKSAVETAPNTTLQVDSADSGARLVLSHGSISVRAAKQPRGKALEVETPGALVTVMGTVFDVHVGKRADGRAETRVVVSEGKVNVASAGKTLSLPRGTIGIVPEGLPPIRRSTVPDVNDMMDLYERTKAIAARDSVAAGFPTILDVRGDASADVWMVKRISNDTARPMEKVTLSARSMLDGGVGVYTLDGEPLDARTLGARVEVNLADRPIAPGAFVDVILRVPAVTGLVEPLGDGRYSFAEPAAGEPLVRIVEFRLPVCGTLKSVSPEPLAAERARERLVVTVACDSRYLELFDQETPSSGETQ